MDKAKLSKMVDRFLSWPLPKDFSPDGGIVFKNSPDARGYAPYQPIGTNLLTAEQARGMIEHILGGEYEELKADNLRLSNLVTKFDTALRSIATEAGMTEAYSGVDTGEKVDGFVNAVHRQRQALEILAQIGDGTSVENQIAQAVLLGFV